MTSPTRISVTEGNAALTDAQLRVADGLAAVRELTDHRIELWAQSPVLDIELVLPPADDDSSNAMADQIR